MDDSYTKEEHKMINETKKILHDPNILITATAVRVPVKNCHSESINIELNNEFDIYDVKILLQNYPGIILIDDIEKNYPEFVAAARSRYFAAQFHILAQINEDIPEKKIIINNIKKIRGKLIKDSSASVRVRGACLLSYFGFDFTVKILNKMNKHKYI